MSIKTSGRLVGALFLISNVTFLLGAVGLVEPVLGDSNYLTLASDKSAQVITGSFLEIINAVAFVGIAVLVYPILKSGFKSMAIGYVAFRVFEFVMQTISDISALSVVTLSRKFVGAGAPDLSAFQASGEVLLAARAWALQMVTIGLVLGAVLFYIMLYRTRLIPRFISVWGFIAALLVLATAFADIYGVDIGALENLGVLMLANEVFMGIWLLIRGFTQPTFESAPV